MFFSPQHICIQNQEIQERGNIKFSLLPVSNPDFAPLDYNLPMLRPYFQEEVISKYMMESK